MSSRILLDYLDYDLEYICNQGHENCADKDGGMCSLAITLELEDRGLL